MLVAAVAVLAGAAVVLAPWGLRLWRDLDAERAARAREEERALTDILEARATRAATLARRVAA